MRENRPATDAEIQAIVDAIMPHTKPKPTTKKTAPDAIINEILKKIM